MAKTKDFGEVLRRKLAAAPDLEREVAHERLCAHIACQIYEARTEQGLTQKELADLIGSKQSVIARLESSDYSGHSLSMLQKIASALDKNLRVDLYSKPQIVAVSQMQVCEDADWRASENWHPEIKTLLSI